MTDIDTVRHTPHGVRVELRVIPRSRRTTIDGTRDGRVVLRVTAPPVEQAANDAVVAALADILNMPRRAIRIVSGQTSRNKSVEIEGGILRDVTARLGLG